MNRIEIRSYKGLGIFYECDAAESEHGSNISEYFAYIQGAMENHIMLRFNDD